MFWVTVSSWSYFCWLYRASPSLAAKNIINLILLLTIWWCPCVESSLLLLEEVVCYDQRILSAEFYPPLPCFILYSKAKFDCYSRCFLKWSEVKWNEVDQSCPTLCDPMDCILPGSSVHGIFQARVLGWVAISFSRGSARPRDCTQVSLIVGRCFTVWATRNFLLLHSCCL